MVVFVCTASTPKFEPYDGFIEDSVLLIHDEDFCSFFGQNWKVASDFFVRDDQDSPSAHREVIIAVSFFE